MARTPRPLLPRSPVKILKFGTGRIARTPVIRKKTNVLKTPEAPEEAPEVSWELNKIPVPAPQEVPPPDVDQALQAQQATDALLDRLVGPGRAAQTRKRLNAGELPSDIQIALDLSKVAVQRRNASRDYHAEFLAKKARLKRKLKVKREAVEIEEQIAEQTARKKAWQRSNQNKVDTGELTNLFSRVTSKLVGRLLPSTVMGIASVSAIHQTNDALALGMELEGQGIDIGEFEAFIRRVLRIRGLNDLLEVITLDERYRHLIMERAIAREFPYKEGRSDLGDRKDRNTALSQDLLKEMRNLRKARITPTGQGDYG